MSISLQRPLQDPVTEMEGSSPAERTLSGRNTDECCWELWGQHEPEGKVNCSSSIGSCGQLLYLYLFHFISHHLMMVVMIVA